MNRAMQLVVYVVLAWLMVATLAGCVLAPPREVPPQTGRVLDEETQQPIEGAIVVLRWKGVGTKAFVDTETVCYHVESAESDANGRYTTRPWKEESRYRDLSMKQILETVYQPGYRHVRADRATGNQYLRREMGGVKERLEYLKGIVVRCDTRREENKKLRVLYEELLSEVGAMSLSADQRLVPIWLQNHVDEIDMGFEEAERIYLQRLRNLEIAR